MTTMSPAMESAVAGIRPPSYRLPAQTRIGMVRLAVSNLESSIAFYGGVVGLAVLERTDRFARLGTTANGTILEMEEGPGVRPLGRATRLGLYHTAFLLPSREDLSSFILHLRRRGVPFAASDHAVSEAVYVADPDGLAVEVYADRDRAEWPFDGPELAMDTKPLQFAALPQPRENSWQGAPAGTSIGHVHLYVGDLPTAALFYHAALGLDIMTWRYPGALFLSAGGYHHHVGANVWAAESPMASDADPRLLFWELVLPTTDDVARAADSLQTAGFFRPNADSAYTFTDPWGITVRLTPGSDAA
jgi:catechol 2,3-dioxygenase